MVLIEFMKKLLFLFFLFLASFNLAVANPSTSSDAVPQTEETESFNAGKLIIDHIVDSHEWHIATFGHTHLTIPLPIILIDKGKLVIFSSSRFHGATESHLGYKIETASTFDKGKIVKVIPGTMQTDVAAGKPLDFSITKTVAGIFISVLLIIFLFINVARSFKKNSGHAPKGLQSLIEPLIIFIRDEVAKPSIGAHYSRFLPFLLTLFFFIFLNNLIGLVPLFPGGTNVTGNIGVTLVLALATLFVTNFSGNKSYWLHIFNPPGIPWWLKFPIPLFLIIELTGVFVKPFVLMIRLFANMVAGHIIVLGFISLIFIFGNVGAALAYTVSPLSIIFAVFIGLLELLVAFIQAYVFVLLSAIYIGMATEEHHENVEVK
ncbi:F0F1 ATP synthase subunit A [Lentimicrobium sp.]